MGSSLASLQDCALLSRQTSHLLWVLHPFQLTDAVTSCFFCHGPDYFVTHTHSLLLLCTGLKVGSSEQGSGWLPLA